jgi:hypothetical protein
VAASSQQQQQQQSPTSCINGVKGTTAGTTAELTSTTAADYSPPAVEPVGGRVTCSQAASVKASVKASPAATTNSNCACAATAAADVSDARGAASLIADTDRSLLIEGSCDAPQHEHQSSSCTPATTGSSTTVAAHLGDPHKGATTSATAATESQMIEESVNTSSSTEHISVVSSKGNTAALTTAATDVGTASAGTGTTACVPVLMGRAVPDVQPVGLVSSSSSSSSDSSDATGSSAAVSSQHATAQQQLQQQEQQHSSVSGVFSLANVLARFERSAHLAQASLQQQQQSQQSQQPSCTYIYDFGGTAAVTTATAADCIRTMAAYPSVPTAAALLTTAASMHGTPLAGASSANLAVPMAESPTSSAACVNSVVGAATSDAASTDSTASGRDAKAQYRGDTQQQLRSGYAYTMGTAATPAVTGTAAAASATGYQDALAVRAATDAAAADLWSLSTRFTAASSTNSCSARSTHHTAAMSSAGGSSAVGAGVITAGPSCASTDAAALAPVHRDAAVLAGQPIWLAESSNTSSSSSSSSGSRPKTTGDAPTSSPSALFPTVGIVVNYSSTTSSSSSSSSSSGDTSAQESSTARSNSNSTV